MYNSVHNFKKYDVSYFNEISSVDSKCYTINKFHKDFKKIERLGSKNKETKQRKITVLKNASLLYYELINMYKKEYNQVFESKDEDWNYKNLKHLDYQANKAEKEEKEEK